MSGDRLVHRNAAIILKGVKAQRRYALSEANVGISMWGIHSNTLSRGERPYAEDFARLKMPLETAINTVLADASGQNRPCVIMDMFSDGSFLRPIIERKEPLLTYPQDSRIEGISMSLTDERGPYQKVVDSQQGLEHIALPIYSSRQFDRVLEKRLSGRKLDLVVVRSGGALSNISPSQYGPILNVIAGHLNTGGRIYVEYKLAPASAVLRERLLEQIDETGQRGFNLDVDSKGFVFSVEKTSDFATQIFV